MVKVIIRVSEHALKRIKEREIEIELLEQVVNEPFEVIDVKFGRKAGYRKLDGYYLVVIFEEQKDEIVDMVSIEFDSEVNAMYIRFKKGKVDKSEPLADNIIVDVDKKGEAIGIEILLPKQDLRVSELVSSALKAAA